MITGQVTEDRRMESCRQGEGRRLSDLDERLRNEPCLEPKHKIFLSHSGVQKNFTEQLCVDLERVHHFPFFDKRPDSLPKGKHFPSLIIKAAKQCRVAIVVLSEEFFTRSKWPMIELNEFVQAKASNNSGLEILPLFLGITIAEFNSSAKRKDWEDVWQGFADEDRKGRIDVKKWVHALSVLDGLNGIEYVEIDGEVTYRKKVVAAVCKLIPPDIKWDVSHVQSTVELCEPILRKMHEVGVPLCNGARVVGLYGTGGVGKTTIAKVLYNQKFKEFAGKVCLVELGPDKAPAESLKIVLRVLTEVNEEILPNEEGKLVSLFKERMDRQQVFLVLDNVSENQVGEALTFLEGKFKQGSIVLVISRSLGILQRLRIRDGDCMEMPELEKEYATRLFRYYAAPREPLTGTDLEIIDECVEECHFLKKDLGLEKSTRHYHPLALRVLGGQMGGKSRDPLRWVEPLNKLKDRKSNQSNISLLRDVYSVLRQGYDWLDPDQQHIFLDLALNVVPQSAWYNNSVWEWLSVMYKNMPQDDIKESVQGLWRMAFIEDVREGDLLSIKIHDLFLDVAKEEARAGRNFEDRRFLYHTGGADVPRELLKRPPGPPGSCWSRLERLVIRNCDLRNLKAEHLQRCCNVEVLQLIDCKLLEDVDIQGMENLISLEISGCPVLGKKFKGVEKLSNLVWLRWKDLCKPAPFLDCLAPLTELLHLELTFLPPPDVRFTPPFLLWCSLCSLCSLCSIVHMS